MSDDGQWKDLLGSGSLLIKTLKKGNECRPLEKQLVTVSYVGTVLSGKDDVNVAERQVFVEAKERTLRIGDEEIPTGLEMAVRYLTVGAEAEVKTGARFAYGEKGDAELKVPGNAWLHYTLCIHSVGALQPEVTDMDTTDRLAFATQWKVRGNHFWNSQKDFYKANQRYCKALSFLKEFPVQDVTSEEQLVEYHSLQISLGNNLGMTYMLMKDVNKALEACLAVLQIDRDNMKALLRAGQLSLQNHNFDEVKVCLENAERLEPTNPRVLALRKKFTLAKKQYKLKQKERWGGFLNNPKATAKKKTDTLTKPEQQQQAKKIEEEKAEILPAKQEQKTKLSQQKEKQEKKKKKKMKLLATDSASATEIVRQIQAKSKAQKNGILPAEEEDTHEANMLAAAEKNADDIVTTASKVCNYSEVVMMAFFGVLLAYYANIKLFGD